MQKNINYFYHNVEKWSNILKKADGIHIFRF